MAERSRTNHTTAARGRKTDAEQAPSAGAVLNRAEIAARCLAAPTPSERRRWQVVALLADGVAEADVVAATGYRPRTIRDIVRRYREAGAAALADARAHSLGAPPLLVPALQDELRRALLSPPPDGGTWTGPKVARWIAGRIGQRVHRQRGWEYLRRLGAVAQAVPSPGDADL